MAEPGPVRQAQTDVWRQLRAERTRAQFEAAHPYPFLVSAGACGAGPGAQQVSFHTVVQPQRSAMPFGLGATGVGAPDLSNLELMVFPIRKAPENPFPERISLGRALNCDIAIRDGSISKLHGHFRDVTASSAVFVDAKSANGTRIDGVVLEPGTPSSIGSQTRVAFGRVSLELLTAGQLYDIL